jgi:CheY-like chemotaxis protein
VQPLMTEKGLSWQIDCPDEMPQIYADRIRIRQVVLNLLSNAARATRRGSITLGVTRRTSEILLSVADTGPGIAHEVAELIFEPFIQGGQESQGREASGSGLGLSISKRFVELHGGRMWLESEVGKGTTFYVSVPISGPTQHPTRPGHEIREEWPWVERHSRPRLPNTHFQPRIVLCDATNQLGRSLSQLSHDAEIVTEPDLPAAIHQAARLPAAALILNHPSARELLDAVQQAAQALPDTPVLGWNCPPSAEPVPLNGVSAYLTKPVRRSDLQTLLATSSPSPRRVLVVEDDPDTQELMRMMLHSLDPNLAVTTVASAEDALDSLEAEACQLALVDIVLPGQSGWDLIAEVHRRRHLRPITTAIVSGQDAPTDTPGSRLLVAALHQPVALPSLLTASQRVVRAYAHLSVEPSRTQR